MSEKQEKRMVESYEITQGICIGDKEVVFGVDEKKEMPYLCAFYTSNDIFDSYSDCMIGDDYVELMELFAGRVQEQCKRIRAEQQKVTVSREPITAEMCFKDNRDESIVGKVVAVKAEILRPEYRSADYQLIYVTGGNGANGNSRGNACYYTNLYSGERGRWERYDILGEVKPECLPQWAKEKLEGIQKQEMETEVLKPDRGREV
ncbi:hypothetical protein [Faecalicatena contorta]|uniref:Uncharacterized protein n=1 Tax=Faecalicatena contorta TaxID=39482 RepID=A0A315ZR75_9FIRM|nr:hypothetical protein [Faecalicatena contorta]PWJ47799.1 hypothetical protein A8805_11654 [Faecalicatena contorta]SUQ15793.1 hypothetical protein SAMN05216529_11654 [Faecalicatena contorta]